MADVTEYTAGPATARRDAQEPAAAETSQAAPHGAASYPTTAPKAADPYDPTESSGDSGGDEPGTADVTAPPRTGQRRGPALADRLGSISRLAEHRMRSFKAPSPIDTTPVGPPKTKQKNEEGEEEGRIQQSPWFEDCAGRICTVF